METRINNTIEIRVNQQEQNIVLAGWLPVGQLSDTLMDAKGKMFREKIGKGVFSRALIAKGEENPKLLINHDYSQELPVERFEYEEVIDKLRFVFILPLLEEVLEKLEDLREAKLSFGFKVAPNGDIKTPKDKNIAGYDYERLIAEMAEFVEISVLKDKLPAYPQSKAYSGSEDEVKVAVAKDELKTMRKELSKIHQAEIDRMRQYINAKKGNNKMLEMAGYTTVKNGLNKSIK